MLKYRGAFYENDFDRYCEYIDNVKNGKAKMHTGVLTPYDVIAPCFNWRSDGLSAEERNAMDVTWNALEDFGNDENALAVIDGSGSMFPGQLLLRCRSEYILPKETRAGSTIIL